LQDRLLRRLEPGDPVVEVFRGPLAVGNLSGRFDPIVSEATTDEMRRRRAVVLAGLSVHAPALVAAMVDTLPTTATS
jgi:hypothetical protein